MGKIKTLEELVELLLDIIETNSDEFGTDYDAVAEEVIDLLYRADYLKKFKLKKEGG